MTPIFPTLIIVKETVLKNIFRIYAKDNIIATISGVPLIASVLNQFFRTLLAWVQILTPKPMIGLSCTYWIKINNPVVGITTTKGIEVHPDEANVSLLSGCFLWDLAMAYHRMY